MCYIIFTMSEDIRNELNQKNGLPLIHEVVENASPSGRSIGRVINYDNYRQGKVCNHTVEGYWFDQDQFENLIDSWASEEDILTILDVTREELDIFCRALYGIDMNFARTYKQLLAISRTLMRHAIGGLAKQGNATALGTATKHFADLKDDNDNNKNVNVTIVNDLKD